MPHIERMDENDVGGIGLKDLELSLKKRFRDNELKVIDYKAKKLLPAGENFCSILVKLDVVIRKKRNTKEEKLHIVAKTNNPSEKPDYDWSSVFKKELFMYAKLLPAYRDLERETGILECNLINILPTYYGHRNSSRDGIEKVDENSYLLMENMMEKGFYLADRHTGLDFDQASIALKNLARYHALGISLKHKNPVLHKEAIEMSRNFGFTDRDHISKFYYEGINVFRETPSLCKHLEVIEKHFKGYIGMRLFMKMPEEPWATITHGDFWVNNILFHKDETGKVDDIKFVDFQNYVYCSPLRDLPYFICGSLSDETIENYLDDLLDLYYNNFIETLKKLNCDIVPYTRKAFDIELRKQALEHIPRNAVNMKFFVYKVEDESNDKNILNNVFESGWSEEYIKKLVRLIGIYEKIGCF